MCAESCASPGADDDLPPRAAQIEGADLPLLSGRLAVLRSGQHLADIAERLRDLEAILIEADGGQTPSADRLLRARRARLQAMDLILQELTALSALLVDLSEHACDSPNQVVDALVDLPRLQSLAQALRATEELERQRTPSAEIVLF